MSPRPRKESRTAQSSGGALSLPAASPSVEVVALTECIIGDTRRQFGERFTMPADRAAALTAVGHIIPDAYFDFLHPTAAAMWRHVGTTRTGLTGAALVCDPDTAARIWSAEGRILTPAGVASQYREAEPAINAIRVLNLTQYDPGSSVYRYHSAANTVPGLVSAFVRYGYANPHCHLRQWDGELHRRTVELLALTADVIHVHMDYRALHQELRYALRSNQRAAITYHGSVLPTDTGRVLVDHEADARMSAITFGARPYHARYGVPRYLPIPMPVADYAALAASNIARDYRAGPVLRVAHSPTRREIKGTAQFLSAIQYLQTEGVGIEAVLIEDMDHGDALRLKATCDVTFDSFWLGMQGSGLEAAAMGQAVIAGDPQAAEEAAGYNAGVVPWTFADDFPGLVRTLRRFAEDPAFLEVEQNRAGQYVSRVHDYPAVGAQYETFLREAVIGGAPLC